MKKKLLLRKNSTTPRFKAGNEEMSVGSTILGERGQVVIPKDIRERLGLKPGAQLMVLHQKHGPIMLFPIEHMRQFLDGMTSKMSQMVNK
jgi:AbrB family looped-hinge helix DNA binding protein